MTPAFARLLMTASAVFLALLGLPCVFAPDVVLRRLVGNTSTVAEIVVQLTGALYVGFAALNWMSRGSLMGGIYGRPVGVGNLLHFFSGGLAVVKVIPVIGAPAVAWPVCAGYLLFAVGFGLVVLRNPVARNKDSA
jgi:hypothetical protein